MTDNTTRIVTKEILQSWDELPSTWKYVALSDVSELQQGKTPKRSDYDDETGYRIIKVKDFNDGESISLKASGDRSFVRIDFGNKYTLTKGDILILSAAHSSKIVGQKVGFVKEVLKKRIFFVSELIRIRPKKNLLHPYFALMSLMTKATRYQIRERVKGGHLYPRDLGKIIIPLPPLPEQRNIAFILSTVQDAIEKTEAVIKAAKELKKSLMEYLFTYGPVPITEKVKLKETEIGKIPEKWGIQLLKELFNIKQGKALNKKTRAGSNQKPFLRTSNVFWGHVDIDKIDFMHFTEEEIKKLALKKGDLLVCEGGDVGRTAIWSGEIDTCMYQNHIHRLRSKIKEIFPLFYMYWMQNAILLRKLYISSANRTTIPNLSKARLGAFVVPKPELKEQYQIGEYLSIVDQKIRKNEEYKKALRHLFDSLLDNLMTGKIRVKDLKIEKILTKELET